MEERKNNTQVQLNDVEGFNPQDYLTNLAHEGSQVPEWYLPVQYRLLWFKLKYPDGVIRKKLLKLDEKLVIVEAKIYANRSDSEENYLASAWAQRCFDPTTTYGMRHIECAETSAEGRALGKAGFGSQYSDVDPDEPKEPNPVDTPAKVNPKRTEQSQSANAAVQNKMNRQNPYQTQSNKVQEEQKSEKEKQEEQSSLDESPQTEPKETKVAEQPSEQPSVDESPQSEPKETKAAEQPSEQPSLDESQQSNTETQNETIKDTEKMQNQKQKHTIPTNEMTMEEITKLMTAEVALNVVCTVSAMKGRKMKEVLAVNPSVLKWITERYAGIDKVMKVAATYLFKNADSLSNVS